MSDDQSRYHYRWGSETIAITASEKSAEEIMDVLNDYQGDKDDE